MKSFVLILFIIGLIFIAVGYTENYKNCPSPKIEYRFIPRSFYEEQISSTNLKSLYSDIFNEPSTWSAYPFSNKQDIFNDKNYSNFVDGKIVSSDSITN